MAKFCSKCGTKLEGNFCTNCGAKATEKVETIVVNKDVNDYINDKVRSQKNHDTYRLVVGVIMIFLGACIFIASLNEDMISKFEDIGYDITLGFTLAGLATLAGGILSIMSKKNNSLLLVSGFCYVGAAIFNLAAVHDISILFVLCCIFAPLNFVFYSKTRAIGQE